MSLVPSLLQAIVRVNGDALVMHAGDKPYVVTPTGQVDLASKGLTLDAVDGIVGQLLSADSRNSLNEFGAVQYDLPPIPEFPDEHFTVVAARGGDDLWVEVRRHRVPDEDRIPDEFFTTPPPATRDEPDRSDVEDESEAPVTTPATTEPIAPDMPAPAMAVEAPVPAVAEAPEEAVETFVDLDLDTIEPTPVGPFASVPEREQEAPPLAVIEVPPVIDELPPPVVAEAPPVVHEPFGAEPRFVPAPSPAAIESEPPPALVVVEPPLMAVEPPLLIAVVEPPPIVIAPPAAIVAAPPAIVVEAPHVVAEPPIEAPQMVAEAPRMVAEPPPPAAIEPEPPPPVAVAPLAPAAVEPLPPPIAVLPPPTVIVPPLVVAEEPRVVRETLADEPRFAPVSLETPAAVIEAAPPPIAVAPPVVAAPRPPIAVETPPVDAAPPPALETPAPVATEPSPMTVAVTPPPVAVAPPPVVVVSQVSTSPPVSAVPRVTPPASVEPPATIPAAAPSVPAPKPTPPPVPAPPLPPAASLPAQPAVVLPMTRTPIRTEQPASASISDPTIDGLQRLLRISAARGASTLYLSSESRPSVRVDGELQVLDSEPVLTWRDVESLLLTLMPERSHEALRTGAPSEWICDIEEVGRVRCTTFRDHIGPGGVFRLMPTRTVSADQLGLSKAIQALAIEPEGVILVVGPRSSGKRTLISAFVDLINRTRRDHVITIEREISIVHQRGSSFISQREVRGGDDELLAAARAALREDPDVLVVEDLRTGALMNVALEAASSGRLVIGGFSAHTATAAIDRIIDLYAPEHRRQVQFALADNLRGVISQVLLRKIGGGRTPAREVLLNTPAVSSVLAEGKTSSLPMAIEGGRRYGMIPFSDSLVSLVQNGTVDGREAYRHATDRAGLLAALKHYGVDTSFVERLA